MVNHTVELTEEEKAEARRNAIRKAESESLRQVGESQVQTQKIEDNN